MNNTDILLMSDDDLVKIIRLNINPNVPTSQYSRAKNELELRDREKKLTSDIKSDLTKQKPQITDTNQYVDVTRIKELMSIKSDKLDLTKLIRFCEEINSAYQSKNYFSVIFLLRAILDHTPPIFGYNTFNQVCGAYGKKSFKEISTKLNLSSRKLADSYLHDPIRKKETLPNITQVNFSQELDFLLGEIVSQF